MSHQKFVDYISQNRISVVECLVADMNGTARGKILPPKKFLNGQRTQGLRIPAEPSKSFQKSAKSAENGVFRGEPAALNE